MKAKLFTLFIVLGVQIGTLFASTKIGDIYYNLDETNKTALVTYGGYSGDVVIPSKVSYATVVYSVIGILGDSFCYSRSLNWVTIPNSVTFIERHAFKDCSGLTRVTFGNGITNIANEAFSGCTSLTNVNLPSSLTDFGTAVFENCSTLTAINVATDNPNYRSIGGVLFSKDKTTLVAYPSGKQGTYTIPSSVTNIETDAFYTCSNLTSVTIPNSVTSIGAYAFFLCSNLASITCFATEPPTCGNNSVFDDRSITVYVPAGSVEVYKTRLVWKKLNIQPLPAYTITWLNSDSTLIDQTIVELESLPTHEDPTKPSTTEYAYTFTGWEPAITPVSGDATYIATYDSIRICPTASGYCGGEGDGTNLTWELNCDGILTISGVGAMKNWTVSSNAPWYSSRTDITRLVISNTVTTIGDLAFESCTSLTSVTIGDNVTSIGEEAFENCSTLTNINIPNGVTNIGWDAFRDCITLTNITIGSNVTTIGGEAFYGCSSLTSVTIPYSVTSIEGRAFYGCSSLTSIIIPDGVTNFGYGVFDNCTNLPVIGNLRYADTYLVGAVDKTLSSYTVRDGTRWIGHEAFYACTNLMNTTLPNSLTNIGESAFRNCSNFASVTIPNGVTSIGFEAFYGCSSLASVYDNSTIPQTISSRTFFDVALSSCTLYVPCGSLAAYQATDVWKDFGTIVEEPCTYAITWLNYDGIVLKVDSLLEGATPSYSGETPTKPVTAGYAYTFIGWTPEITAVTGDAIYTAEFDSVVNQYTITFNNYDGTELQSGKLDYGAMPAYNGETPMKPATAQYTYSFKGWKPEVVAVTGDAVYTAEFDSVVNQYTITFNNYDGTELQSGKLDYGAMPAYNGEEPVKLATAQYTYSFKGWKPEVVAVTGDAVYTADFDSIVNEYDVTFHANGNGTAPEGQHLAYGSKVTKPADLKETGWTFGGWYTEAACINAWDFDNDIVEGNLDLYAKWSPNTDTKYFVLHWQQNLEGDGYTMYEGEVKTGTTGAQTAAEAKTYEGFVLAHNFEQTTIYANGSAKVDIYYNRIVYQVNFKIEGTIVQTDSLRYGATPKYNGTEPTKPADAQYTYTFAGWSPEVAPITGDVTYTAIFDGVVNQYTITFLNEDGTILDSRKWDYGAVPTCNEPTKPATPKYMYTFAGWTPQVVAVVGDATYTAQFDATLIIYDITTEPATGEQHGSVDINGTAYYEATVTLTATPEDGYYFVSWNDGVIDNPRQIVIVSDTTLYPIFAECEPITTNITATIYDDGSYRVGDEVFTTRGTHRVTLSAANGCDSIVVLRLNVIKLPTYNVRLEVNNESYGSVSGAGTYKKNQEATITATPKAKGYRFTWWFNSATQEKITANPYTFTVTEDVLWRAVFSRAVKTITIEYRSAPRRMMVDADETYAIVSVSEKLAEINNISGETYYLYDASGKLISTSREDKQYTLPSGMYIIRIEDQTEKFIVP